MSNLSYDTESPLDPVLAELFDAACDECLNNEEHDRLATLLRESKEARQSFLEYCHLHTTLRRSGNAMRIVSSAVRKALDVTEVSQSDGSRVQPQVLRQNAWLARASRHPLRFSIAVTFVGLCALLAVLAVTPVSTFFVHGDTNQKHGDVESATAKEIATLTGWHRIDWRDGYRISGQSHRLRAGQKVAMRSGLAEVTYDTGAKVVIEGPCEFVLGGQASGNQASGTSSARSSDPRPSSFTPHPSSSNSGYLALGKLVARCDTADSQGFTITTPSGEFVDMGTEFGIDVDERGETELHVFEGKVDAAVVDVEGQVVGRHQFTSGQAGRIKMGTHRVARFDADSTRYARIPAPADVVATSNELTRVTVQFATRSLPQRHQDRIVDGSGMMSGGRHNTELTHQWDSGRRDGMKECIVEFDLGDVYRLDRVRVWNWNNANGPPLKRGAKDVEILVAEADGGEFKSLGMFEFKIALGVDGDRGFDVPNFPADIIAHDVRFRIISNFIGPFGADTLSGHDRVGLAEVRFYGTLPFTEQPEAAGTTDKPESQE